MYSLINNNKQIKLTTSSVLFLLIIINDNYVQQCHQQQQQQQRTTKHNWTSTSTFNADQRQLRGHNLVIATTTTQQPTTTATPVELPDFNEPIGNLTVPLGRDAQLSCKINNLKQFKTAWLRVEDKGILTIHNNVITRNYRFGLINNDDGKNFILTIKNVQPSDRGGYMCQINSIPMKYSVGYLDVLTPPIFDDATPPETATLLPGVGSAFATTIGPLQLASSSSSGQQQATTSVITTISEGSNANLTCRASGHPQPVISWRREDNEPILLNGHSIKDYPINNENSVADSSTDSSTNQKFEGSILQFNSVARINSGAYLCIASNGVQPSASRRQVLDVQFSPIIRLPQIELGAQLKQERVELNCFVELNPLGSYHWVKLDHHSSSTKEERIPGGLGDDDLSLIEHDELLNSDKFEIVIKQLTSEKVHMILTIRHLEKHDFACYKCIAKNSQGIQSSSIRLYESSSTSSFSLNNMFRGGGGGGSTSTGGAGEVVASPQHQDQSAQQQNDQENEPGHRSSNKPILSSRAHTRSSWIQRPSGSSIAGGGGGRGGSGGQASAETQLDSLGSSSGSSSSLLLLAKTSTNLLYCIIIIIAFVAQIVVESFHH